MHSLVMCWTPDQVVWVLALAGELHCVLQQDTHVYNWVPVTVMLGATLQRTE